MPDRSELQRKLERLLGSKNVYYSSPTNLQMEYPAIRYSKKNLNVKRANDAIYSKMTCYELIVISKQPDHPVIDKLMCLPYCSYDRHYKTDNLNHDVLTLYY
jgi:hypothetical protein